MCDVFGCEVRIFTRICALKDLTFKHSHSIVEAGSTAARVGLTLELHQRTLQVLFQHVGIGEILSCHKFIQRCNLQNKAQAASHNQ